MSHPLEEVINNADGFLLIGDSSEDRFPAYSYNAYTLAKKRFYCLDMGGLTESRGAMSGGKVYTSVEELPDDRDDLAIIWVKPGKSEAAVELAHAAGAKRVWFSFKCAHENAVKKANELGMTIVEVGRCPIYYLDDKPAGCKAHTVMVKLSGLYSRPPEKEADKNRRELI